MIRQAIEDVVAGRNLSREQAAVAMGAIMEGQATDAQIAAFLVALRMKGETVDEIVGCAEAMRERMLTVRCDDPLAIDTCGTGGDGAGTFNVSTAVAFVAAGAGATVAKHGNHGVSSRSGSADLLREAGFTLDPPLERVERSLRTARIAFLYAPQFHPAVRHAVGPRREIGLRTIFNATGPLVNPARVRRQVLGVYDRRLVRPLAEALLALGSEAVMVVHGEDGLDEISPETPTVVAEIRDGEIIDRVLCPEDAGLERHAVEGIRGGTARENLDTLRALLEGCADRALLDTVVLNAAAALTVAGVEAKLSDGAERARAAIADGRAAAVFERAAAINRGAS